MGLTKKNIHTDEINYLASVFAILGHPARLSILFYLKEHGFTTVGELTDAIPLAQSTISEHIKVLKKRFLVQGIQTGTSVQYSLHDQVWPILKDVLKGCADGF